MRAGARKQNPERAPRIEGLQIRKTGGADGIRTHALLDAIETRSQLRHGPPGRKQLNSYYIRQSTSSRIPRLWPNSLFWAPPGASPARSISWNRKANGSWWTADFFRGIANSRTAIGIRFPLTRKRLIGAC